MTSTPWHFLVVAIPGWMNRQQQQVIEYPNNSIAKVAGPTHGAYLWIT
jgi:hypothetical protein